MPQQRVNNSGPRPQLYRCAGYGLFVVGLAGTLLPLLPTTIFWILAALCFARSSPAMYTRITSWPRIGADIEVFLQQGAISTRGKVMALFGMTVGCVVAAVTLGAGWLLVLAFAVIGPSAAYVLARPTPRRQEIGRPTPPA